MSEAENPLQIRHLNAELEKARARAWKAEAERDEWKAKYEASEWIRKDNALRTYDGLAERTDRYREALELIAQPKRADGTYNRCREACEELAREALNEK